MKTYTGVKAGHRVIHALVIEEATNVEAGGGLAEEAEIVEAGGGAADMVASRSWYLAVAHSNMLLKNHTSEARDSVGR